MNKKNKLMIKKTIFKKLIRNKILIIIKIFYTLLIIIKLKKL